MSDQFRNQPLWEWSAAWRSILFMGIPWLFSKELTRFLISLCCFLVFVPLGIWLEDTYELMRKDAVPLLYILFYLAFTGFINSDRIFETHIRPYSKGINWTISITLVTLLITNIDYQSITPETISSINIPSPGITAYLWILLIIQILALGATPDLDDNELKKILNLPDHKQKQKLRDIKKRHTKRLILPVITTLMVLIYIVIDPAVPGYSGSGIQYVLLPLEIIFDLTTGQKVLFILTVALFGIHITHMITERDIDQYEDKVLITFESHSFFKVLRSLKNIYVLALIITMALSFFPALDLTQKVAAFVTSNPAAEVFQRSTESAQEALNEGKYEEAAEEFGYAAAAAGASGNLDDLESMLDQLELANSQIED